MDEREAVRLAAEKRYASGADIWASEDRWNAHKRAGIERICRSELGDIDSNARVLNAGAGSHRYSWMPAQAINLDRFAAQAANLPNAVVGDLEALPFPDGEFDLIVCVGPVINYTSAMESITELCRVLRTGGRLILHYETSNSAEHLFTRRWRAPVAVLPTLNNGEADTVWVYSNAFVERALRRNQIEIMRRHAFHIASSALLRLGFSFDAAARAAAFDRMMKPFRFLADDVIIAGRKA